MRLPVAASQVVKATIAERPAGSGRRVDWVDYSSSGICWPQSSGATLGPASARRPGVALGRRVRDFSMMCNSWPLLIANNRTTVKPCREPGTFWDALTGEETGLRRF